MRNAITFHPLLPDISVFHITDETDLRSVLEVVKKTNPQYVLGLSYDGIKTLEVSTQNNTTILLHNQHHKYAGIGEWFLISQNGYVGVTNNVEVQQGIFTHIDPQYLMPINSRINYDKTGQDRE